MSSEESLIQVRKAKHQELNGNTYPLAAAGTFSISLCLSLMSDNPPPVSLMPEELLFMVVLSIFVSQVEFLSLRL
jgi:hypothetical protein